MEITKEEFNQYVTIQKSGMTNMFDVRTVVSLSDSLTRESCLEVMKTYGELEKKYGEED